MIIQRILFISLLFFGLSKTILGQDTIYLNNPSFEDTPRRGGEFSAPIEGWHDCGLSRFPSESPPDIHPFPSAAWGVRAKAFEGETYLGLVIRDNDTWESLSQGIEPGLKSDRCYSFHAYLCLSPKYESPTKKSSTPVSFSNPAVLQIWGGKYLCDKRDLLAISTAVDNHEWKEFTFEFVPTMDCDYLTLEAFFYLPEYGQLYYQSGPYNGHILVDNLSPIIEMECK